MSSGAVALLPLPAHALPPIWSAIPNQNWVVGQPVYLDLDMVDRVEAVSSEESMEWAHKLMQHEGILAGISCGAAMAAADRIARDPEFAGKTIVVVLPDSGERYLSAPLFEGRFSAKEMEQAIS